MGQFSRRYPNIRFVSKSIEKPDKAVAQGAVSHGIFFVDFSTHQTMTRVFVFGAGCWHLFARL